MVVDFERQGIQCTLASNHSSDPGVEHGFGMAGRRGGTMIAGLVEVRPKGLKVQQGGTLAGRAAAMRKVGDSIVVDRKVQTGQPVEPANHMRVGRASQDQGGALVGVAEERPEMHGGPVRKDQPPGAKVKVDLLFDGQGLRADDPVAFDCKPSFQRSLLQVLVPGESKAAAAAVNGKVAVGGARVGVDRSAIRRKPGRYLADDGGCRDPAARPGLPPSLVRPAVRSDLSPQACG